VYAIGSTNRDAVDGLAVVGSRADHAVEVHERGLRAVTESDFSY
jgi:hypothetical protein